MSDTMILRGLHSLTCVDLSPGLEEENRRMYPCSELDHILELPLHLNKLAGERQAGHYTQPVLLQGANVD